MSATTLLRIATAGSVDDGKSTLIGRLLYDSKAVMDDQWASVQRTSKDRGHEYTDLSLVTDGLRAEREQGITIDVAYRYFATPKRKFIIADTPGHIQYTRNMVTGASTAQLVIVLVDARHGLLEQSRRHAFLCSLLRVPHLVLCVNKMDLVDYSQQVFEDIAAEFTDLVTTLSPSSADNGIVVTSWTSRRAANSWKSSRIFSNCSRSQPIRSILLTASTMCCTPSSDARNACRLDCSSSPCRASTSTIASWAVEVPVTMLRVY